VEERRADPSSAPERPRSPLMYLFVDTNAITTMFFSHYYNRDSRPDLRKLADDCRIRYQHVIVCADDIPFEQDGWRDNLVWRGRMQGMVVHDLAVRGISHSTVHGSLEQRVEQVKAILAGTYTSPPSSVTRLRRTRRPCGTEVVASKSGSIRADHPKQGRRTNTPSPQFPRRAWLRSPSLTRRTRRGGNVGRAC
jgi:hypothetical protein